MPRREIRPIPEHVFPPGEWSIREVRYDDDLVEQTATAFALSNGYLGVRGTPEEGRPGTSPGTFVNGFHETWPIIHAEDAFGLARTGQTIVNAPDATVIELFVNDEPLYLPVARLQRYKRRLDMRGGTLDRDVVWSTPAGNHVRVRSQRLVSLEWRHVLAMRFEVTVMDHRAPVVLSSQLRNRQDADVDHVDDADFDPRLARAFSHRVLEPEVVEHNHTRLLYGYRAANSGMTLGIAVDHLIETENRHHTEVSTEDDLGHVLVTVDAEPGVPITITKFAAYHNSRSVPAAELVSRASRTLDRALDAGHDELVRTQREHLERFWDRADVRATPAEPDGGRLQQAIRWNVFQLGQATWRAEGSGIPAKGLTGQAYEGHYFWDTEVYVAPFLAYTRPRIARNLLRFRHSMLDHARQRARTVGQRGALFPWRTINGEEASAYYQAGTAQYHINADVAWAIRKYVDVRGDLGFLAEVGGEILVETARLWVDLGFHGTDGRFHIHGVTGPDEYTTVVNDNAYTNLMARLNLNSAVSAVRRLERERPDAHAALVAECGLAAGEVESWERAAATMYVPFDDERGIHPQDESFLEREIWDLDTTPTEEFPLLLHHHPLVIYRHQVLKQADVVLAMFLLGNEFDLDQKRRNFAYYDPLTTGDSSLSAAVQSIVAAEIGEADAAMRYFTYALLMDLGNVAGNMSDGVHIASTGGVWMSLVFGFGGVRDFDGELSFDPRLPGAWSRLELPLRFRDRQLLATLAHDTERYELLEGDPLEISVRGERHTIGAGEPLVVAAPVGASG